jgi:hypothetical protein
VLKVEVKSCSSTRRGVQERKNQQTSATRRGSKRQALFVPVCPGHFSIARHLIQKYILKPGQSQENVEIVASNISTEANPVRGVILDGAILRTRREVHLVTSFVKLIFTDVLVVAATWSLKKFEAHRFVS